MFDIRVDEGGQVRLSGRLDAAEADYALEVLDTVESAVTLDCAELEYISSAGIGVIMETYKRLLKRGQGLKLVHLAPRVRNVLRFAGLDRVLQIE